MLWFGTRFQLAKKRTMPEASSWGSWHLSKRMRCQVGFFFYYWIVSLFKNSFFLFRNLQTFSTKRNILSIEKICKKLPSTSELWEFVERTIWKKNWNSKKTNFSNNFSSWVQKNFWKIVWLFFLDYRMLKGIKRPESFWNPGLEIEYFYGKKPDFKIAKILLWWIFFSFLFAQKNLGRKFSF